MHIQASPDQARAILKAMFSVAAAGQVTDADRASINAAARYIFRLDADPSVMTSPSAAELQALAANPALANEALRFATVMAFVDGTLDNAKLKAVLALAAKLGVKADYVDDVAKLAQGHLHDATAHMIRANLESVIGHPVATEDQSWFLPYKNKADPALAARFHALADLPANTFGNTFATFYKANKYAFPGEPTGLNFTFAAPHNSAARAGRLRHLAARRATGLDLHGSDASQAGDGRACAAGDPELSPRHHPRQRRRRLRQGRARPEGVLARLGARRGGQGRSVRSVLGFLGRDPRADRCGAIAHRPVVTARRRRACMSRFGICARDSKIARSLTRSKPLP